MTIKTLIKSLIPSIGRSDLMEHVQTTLGELNELTLPPYQSTIEADLFTNSYKPKSKFVKDCESEAKKSLRTNDSLIVSIHKGLGNAERRIEFLVKYVEQDVPSDVNRDGITFPKAIMVDSISQCAFFVKYARHLLMQYYVNEIPAMDSDADKTQPLSKAELKTLDEQFDGFLRVLKVMLLSEDTFTQQFNDVPELMVPATDVEMTQERLVHGNAVDAPAITNGFIPYVISPIFRVRMAVAQWQDYRFRAAAVEKQGLELRLLHLKTLKADGRANASTEQAIKTLDRRIGDLNYKMHKLEK